MAVVSEDGWGEGWGGRVSGDGCCEWGWVRRGVG